MQNSNWNKYEAALLIEGYKRIANGNASRKEVAEELSERLRTQGLIESATYRNVNGITLQLGAIEYLMTDGARGISHVSNLFREIVQLYKEDYAAFLILLNEANHKYPYRDYSLTRFTQKK